MHYIIKDKHCKVLRDQLVGLEHRIDTLYNIVLFHKGDIKSFSKEGDKIFYDLQKCINLTACIDKKFK